MMIQKCVILIGLSFGILTHAFTSGEIDKKVEKLLSQMTLEEKIGQLQQLPGEQDGTYKSELETQVKKSLVGSTLNVRGAQTTNQLQKIAVEKSRLKIPLLFAFDVIAGYRTTFPAPLAQASSWDPQLIQEIESVSAQEAFSAGLKWTFAPMVDIARDPRWGRVVEGAGEDPYLGSQFAKARVLGFQGSRVGEKNKILACAKHWVGYGAAQGGREYNTTDISENELRNIYFPPFKAAVDTGVATLMSAFNDLDGVPASANPFTLKKVLRDEWKFDGIVVSDWTSIDELINHGIASGGRDAAALAFDAGVDIEMASFNYHKFLPDLVKSSHEVQNHLNETVRRILRLKYQLGLFENPYVTESAEAQALSDPEHVKLARTAAAKSFVLLKNEKNILPLSKALSSIAVIGPLADNKDASLGWWRGDRPHIGEKFRNTENPTVSVLEGVRGAISPNTKLTFSRGCEVLTCTQKSIADAVSVAKSASVVILVVGEIAEMSGEAASRTNIGLPGDQLDLVRAIYETGIPVVAVLMNGRPLAISWMAEKIPAILETWLGGQEAGAAIADTLFGDQNPSGKLPMTFPRSVGQIPIYYNQKNTGRPFDPASSKGKYFSKYIDEENSPLFSFGYGLSYTQFKLSHLHLSDSKIHPDGHLQVSVQIENVGSRSGEEVVQLYIHRKVGSVTRPVKELKGFRKVMLAPGKKQIIQMNLGPDELGFFGRNMNYSVESGQVDVLVGNSSDTLLQDHFNIK